MRRLGLLLLAGVCFAAEDVPSWVREAAARTAPQYPAKTPFVVLFQEEQLTVEPGGRQITRDRSAVRILQRGGTPPTADGCYHASSGKIRAFQGWLLAPTGRPVSLGKSAVVDYSPSSDAVYDETRCQKIEPGAGLAPGTVFAWEITEEERTVFTQARYAFQDNEPVLTSRFVVTLPPGWEARGTALNHAPIEPQVSAGTYSWELRDLPWVEEEVHSPRFRTLAPHIGVSFIPAPDSPPALRAIKDWSAASAWLSELQDPPAQPTDPVRAKASALTAGAKTDWDKIRAIASFVQKTNYVAVDMNLGYGGGMVPRPAAQVLERNYGDCKDKAALMRALLRAVGIDSYSVGIQAYDRDYVRSEWASPWQFNHDIVAIRAPAGVDAPAVLDHPRLGRLLMFDPTSKTTPLGDLPRGEQGSQGLVVAGKAGELVTMPFLPSHYESEVAASMKPDGSLSAHLQEHYFGQSAVHVRHMMQSEKHDALKQAFERGLSRDLGGLTIERLEPADRMEEGRLDLKLDFVALRFGQTLQGRLLLVTPGQLVSSGGYGFPAKERKLPVRLEAAQHQDSATLTVPNEFKIDELPDPVKIESRYGTYSADWKAHGNTVEFRQSLEVKPMLAPASEYGKIRDFFERVAAARNSPVVLVKQ